MSQNYGTAVQFPSRTLGLVYTNIAHVPDATWDKSAGFLVGDEVVNSTLKSSYICVSNNIGAAVWSRSAGLGIAPRRNKLSWGGGAVSSSSVGSASNTPLWCVPVPDDAYAVRLVVANLLNSSYVIAKAIFAASSSFNDYKNPTGSPTWTPFTWSNAGVDSDLPVYSSATTSFTVPAQGGAADPNTGATNVPSLSFSDWAPISGGAWSATSGIKALMVRTLMTVGQSITRGTANGNNIWTGNSALNFGMDAWAGYRGGEDHVTSPDNIPTTGFGDGQQPYYCVQFLCRSRGVQLMSMGDSHFDGTGSSSGIGDILRRTAVQLNTPTLPVMPHVSAWGGQPSASFFPKFLNDLKFVQPSVVVLQTWSANEPNLGTTGPYQYLSRVMTAAARAEAIGAIPIFVTPYPRNAAVMTGGTLTVWTDIRNRVLAMGDQALVFDATSILGNTTGGVLDGTYKAGLSDDQIHPNDAGGVLLAQSFVPFLSTLLR